MEAVISALLKCADVAYRKGYVNGTSGNISFRTADDAIYISRTGVRFRSIQPEDFIPIMRSSGRGDALPSKEFPMHLAIYQSRPDLKVLVHFHCVECIAASLLIGPERPLPLFTHTHQKKLGRVLITGDYPAGSEQLAGAAAQCARSADAAILYRHGIIAGGQTVEDAFDKAEYLAEACRLFLSLCQQDPAAAAQLVLPSQSAEPQKL